MTERRPWWYSGDEVEQAHRGQGEELSSQDGPSADGASTDSDATDDSAAGSAMDWLALLSGAQRMVDWATEKVMAPHADHADPREHPDCLVCRTLTLIGDGDPRPGEASSARAPEPVAVPTTAAIDWIRIREPGTSA